MELIGCETIKLHCHAQLLIHQVLIVLQPNLGRRTAAASIPRVAWPTGTANHIRKVTAFNTDYAIVVIFDLGTRGAQRAVASPEGASASLVRNDAASHGGIVDLVAVEMENGQHRPVADRIEKLVGMPACSKRPRLGFSIAHDAADQQIGIIKRRAVRMGNGVAQLAAFVD